MKHQLHTYDKSCLSDNPVKDGKCVENMIWLDDKKMLITSTADQILRIWDPHIAQGPVLTIICNHHDHHISTINAYNN